MAEKPLYSVDKTAPIQTEVADPADLPNRSDTPPSGSRRKFLGNVSGAAVAAATVAAIGLGPLLGGKHSISHTEQNSGVAGAPRPPPMPGSPHQRAPPAPTSCPPPRT